MYGGVICSFLCSVHFYSAQVMCSKWVQQAFFTIAIFAAGGTYREWNFAEKKNHLQRKKKFSQLPSVWQASSFGKKKEKQRQESRTV